MQYITAENIDSNRRIADLDKKKRRVEGGLCSRGHYKKSSTDNPLVSIVTVVLNQEHTIEQCIESVLGQSYDNIEYIVIDGDSSDGTLEKIQQYESGLDRYLSEPDNGIYDAMNKGIGLATGDYILLLNADDWYQNDAVEVLLRAALSKDVAVVHADAIVVDDNGKKVAESRGWLHDGIYTLGASIRHETMLVRREIYDEYGVYDVSYRIIGDYEYMLRLYKAGVSFFHVNAPLLYFRGSGVSNTNIRQRSQERERLFRKLFPFLDQKDLNDLKISGRVPVKERIRLKNKHEGKCALFESSMACNIADQGVAEKCCWVYLWRIQRFMYNVFGLGPNNLGVVKRIIQKIGGVSGRE